jgi:hypothetical protein
MVVVALLAHHHCEVHLERARTGFAGPKNRSTRIQLISRHARPPRLADDGNVVFGIAAVTHALQPLQAFRSTTMPHRCF